MRRTALVTAPVTALAATAALLVPAGAIVAGAAEPGEYRPVRGPSAPEEHRYAQKTATPGVGLPRHAYENAAAQALRVPATGDRWRFVGPTNIGGRIVGLALDPHRRDVLYAAAASGGLWKSTDAGRTFAPAWPQRLTQAMGAVTAAPDGTLYAGTGEPQPGGGSITYEGTGLYSSRDGGRSWKSCSAYATPVRSARSLSTRATRGGSSWPRPARCTTAAASAACTGR